MKPDTTNGAAYYHLRRVDCTRSSVCGLAMLNPGWCHMRRCLETETVLLIGKRGSAQLEDDGTPLEIAAGRMLLLPAGHVHCGMYPVEQPLSYWWFHFYQCLVYDDELRIYLPKRLDDDEAHRVLAGHAAAESPYRHSVVLPQHMELAQPELVGNLCGEALREYAHSVDSPMAYNNAVQRLLLELGRESMTAVQSRSETGASHALVQQVLELLESELSNPNASVKFFADALGVNADYLGRCFKEVTAQPVGQYLNRRRVELACSRLRESNRSVEKIATACGFGSRRQFYDEFKRRTGKTPAAYRAESAYVGVHAL